MLPYLWCLFTSPQVTRVHDTCLSSSFPSMERNDGRRMDSHTKGMNHKELRVLSGSSIHTVGDNDHYWPPSPVRTSESPDIPVRQLDPVGPRSGPEDYTETDTGGGKSRKVLQVGQLPHIYYVETRTHRVSRDPWTKTTPRWYVSLFEPVVSQGRFGTLRYVWRHRHIRTHLKRKLNRNSLIFRSKKIPSQKPKQDLREGAKRHTPPFRWTTKCEYQESARNISSFLSFCLGSYMFYKTNTNMKE